MNSSLNINAGFDWKSLTIGLLIGMIVLMSLGHSGEYRNFGRYSAVGAGDSVDTIFIVDVYTGQTWRMDGNSKIDYGVPDESALPVERR